MISSAQDATSPVLLSMTSHPHQNLKTKMKNTILFNQNLQLNEKIEQLKLIHSLGSHIMHINIHNQSLSINTHPFFQTSSVYIYRKPLLILPNTQCKQTSTMSLKQNYLFTPKPHLLSPNPEHIVYP